MEREITVMFADVPAYNEWAELIAAEGPFIKAASDGQPEELCKIDLDADVAQMQAVRDDLAAVTVPEAASKIHQIVTRGASEWQQGLEYSADYCVATKDWEKTIALAGAAAAFSAGTLDFANAMLQYSTALEQAWKSLGQQ